MTHIEISFHSGGIDTDDVTKVKILTGDAKYASVYAWCFFKVVDDDGAQTAYQCVGIINNGSNGNRYYLESAAEALIRQNNADVVYDETGSPVASLEITS